jgi:hypothetical protein
MMIRGVVLARVAQMTVVASICVVLAACGGSGSPASNSAGSGNAFTGSVASAGATGSSPTDKSTTLSWSAPTRNSDGSQITNLAGYTLHYGTAPQDYTGSIEITNPTATSYVVSGNSFPAGTYYFAISAYNAEQVSSSMSGEISVTVD